MDRAAVPASAAAVLFKDGFGERRQIADPTGNESLELLCLRNELSTVPSFEFALRERVSRLSGFRHAQFGRARTVERTSDASLAMISERASGARLSEMLVNADQRRLGLDITAALGLIRQLVPAMAAFHESARDIAHGAIGPERIVVTPGGQLIVMEYVLGAALEQLRYPRERYWSELRVALPNTSGLPRFDQRADVTQIGVVALSLILGRPMRDDEYPARIADVVASTWAVSPRGGFEPLPPGLRGWIGRLLQLDSRTGFATAVEARVELDKMMGDSDAASQASLAAFLARYSGAAPSIVTRPVPVATPPQATAPPVKPPQPPTPPPVAAPSPVTPPVAATPAVAATPPVAAIPTAMTGTPRPATATPPRGTPVAPAAVSSNPPPAVAKPSMPVAAPVQTTPPRGTAVAPPAASVKPSPAPVSPEFEKPKPPAVTVTTPAYGLANPAIGGPPKSPVTATPAAGTSKPAAQYTPPAGTPSTIPPPRPAPPAAPPSPPKFEFQSMAESVAVKPTSTPPRGVPRPAPKPASSEITQTSAMRIPKPTPSEITQTSAMRIPRPPASEITQTSAMRIPQFHVGPVEVADDSSQSLWKKRAVLAAALVVLVGAGAFAAREFLAPASTPTATGTVVFTTNPPGAQVVVDGQVRGVTPITLTVTSGPHKVDLHGANGSKTTAVSVAAGTQVAQYIELPHAALAATGQLQVRTEPAGARVSVDGVARGTAPTTVADLAPGEHAVVLESNLGSIKQTVTIEAGVTASLVVPLSAPEGAPVSGWIAVTSRVELQLYEKDRLLGTSRTDRLMVSAGKHEIDLVNDDLGYRTSRTVQVPAGKVATVNLEMPNGSIAINAAPWAEVWIDGNKVGETPIGNLSLPIGNHDVVFRHPELGEQHHTATVSLKNAARLSVDLRKP